jgi:hypothetical protein
MAKFPNIMHNLQAAFHRRNENPCKVCRNIYPQINPQKLNSDWPSFNTKFKFSKIAEAACKDCPFCTLTLLCTVVNHFAVLPGLKAVFISNNLVIWCSLGGIWKIEFGAARGKPLAIGSASIGKMVVEEVVSKNIHLYRLLGLFRSSARKLSADSNRKLSYMARIVSCRGSLISLRFR